MKSAGFWLLFYKPCRCKLAETRNVELRYVHCTQHTVQRLQTALLLPFGDSRQGPKLRHGTFVVLAYEAALAVLEHGTHLTDTSHQRAVVCEPLAKSCYLTSNLQSMGQTC